MIGIYLTALERTDTVARYIDRTQEKERYTHAESTRFDRVATSFLSIHFLYLYLFCKKYVETLYTGKICRLKSHRLCVILVDRLENRLNIMSLLIEEYDR